MKDLKLQAQKGLRAMGSLITIPAEVKAEATNGYGHYLIVTCMDAVFDKNQFSGHNIAP